MAGPVPTYLTTQQAAQTAFTVPFGLLTLVNAKISAASAAGEFNTTVDASLFTAEDVANLGIYLDSLGYGVNFAKNSTDRTLNIDWERFRDTPGTAVTVFQGTTPWIIAGTVNQGVAGTDPWPVTISSFPGSISVTQGTTPWTVDGTVNVGNFPAVQPISGTVTANQGTSPWVVSGTITTSPDVNIHDSAGNSLNSTSGSLDVNVTNSPATVAVTQSTSPWVVSGSVAVTNFPAVQPVSGTVTCLQGISPWIVGGTVAATQSGAWTTGRTWALTSGTDSVAAVQSGTWTVEQGTPPWSVSVTNFPAVQPVSGTVMANQGTSPWVVSGTVAATQSGAWSTGRTWALASGTDSVASVQSGAWTTGRTWALSSGTDSVAVSGTVAATQSGTWTVQQGTPPWSVSQSGTWTTGRTWALASGTDSVAAVQSGSWTVAGTGNFTVVQPTGTNLHTVVDSGSITVNNAAGASAVNIQDGGNSITVDGTVTANQGTANSIANAWPVKLTDGTDTVAVNTDGSINNRYVELATYTASTSGSAITTTTPQDVFTITGSNTKTIRIVKIAVSMTITTAATVSASLIKRAANSGGTSSAVTAVAFDSNNAAATATVLQYTANPTPGAGGFFMARRIFVPTTTSVFDSLVEWDFTNMELAQRPTLRGTNQTLAINMGGTTITGANPSFYVVWTEE